MAGVLHLLHQAEHGFADLGQVTVVHARADVHVQADQAQAAFADHVQGGAQVAVPDTVLGVLAASVGLVAVAVAETGVDAQPHRVAGSDFAQLAEHVDGAGVHRDAVLDHGFQGGAVQQVCGEDDLGFILAARIAGGQGAQQFALGDSVDLHALFAHQAQDVQVGAGLLGEADDVEALQTLDLTADGGGVVDPQRGAELRGELLGAGQGEESHEWAPNIDGASLPGL